MASVPTLPRGPGSGAALGQHPIPRRHPRYEVRLSAEIHLGEDTFTAATRNLSEGGAGLECTIPLTEGQQLLLALFLVLDDVEDERSPPLWVKGRVAWCACADDGHSHTAGVRFEVITDEQKAWLRRVIAHMQGQDGAAG
jgi:hypothetical protein